MTEDAQFWGARFWMQKGSGESGEHDEAHLRLGCSGGSSKAAGDGCGVELNDGTLVPPSLYKTVALFFSTTIFATIFFCTLLILYETGTLVRFLLGIPCGGCRGGHSPDQDGQAGIFIGASSVELLHKTRLRRSLPDVDFMYIKSNGGLVKEAAYPYEGHEGACRRKGQQPVAKISGFRKLPTNNEEKVAQAVAKQPVSVGFDASRAFQFHKRGVFTGDGCNKREPCGDSGRVPCAEDGTQYF
ncbi:Zingipain-1 [Dichanthelium oligosanthes]|uniref:Zingipain-1 n=1 Tax=Dichanthelium oligosanthes TaxID=888268 RepID=A0A1E5VRK8_9POAL|nr:Zingipain-1 [Dichanthelium oligosanthes]